MSFFPAIILAKLLMTKNCELIANCKETRITYKQLVNVSSIIGLTLFRILSHIVTKI